MAEEKLQPKAAVVAVVESPGDKIIEQWFVETFHNRGLDVTLYNHVFAAKEILKTRLAALVIKE